MTAFLAAVVVLTSGYAIPIGIVVNRPGTGGSAAAAKRCPRDVENADRSTRSTSNDERGDRVHPIFRWLL